MVSTTLRKFKTLQDQKKVVELYLNGNSIEEISKYFKCSSDTISRVLHRNNIIVYPSNTRMMNNLNKDKILNLYKSGIGMKNISKLCNCGYSSVYSIIHADKSIKIRKRQSKIIVDDEWILKLYNEGNLCKDIEKITGYSEWCIGRSLKKQGINTRNRFKNQKTPFNEYKEKVRFLTECNYKIYKDIINPKKLKRGRTDYHIDHIFSVSDGFKNKIPPEIISHYTNLRMMESTQNESKNYKSDKTIEELYNDYNNSI